MTKIYILIPTVDCIPVSTERPDFCCLWLLPILYFAEFPLFSVPCQLVREIIEAKVEKWSIPPKHLALAFAVSDPHPHTLPSYASPCNLQCNFFYF